MIRLVLTIAIYLCLCCGCAPASPEVENEPPPIAIDERIISYRTRPTNALRMYSTSESGEPFRSIGQLRDHLAQRGDSLRFAMNGGMFLKDLTPQGLYIEEGVEIRPLDTVREAYGNFYLQPNGVFYLTAEYAAGIQTSQTFLETNPENISFATQSGPMLVINKHLHQAFNEGSSNVHIRNGVGILPTGELIFAISTKKINFYDFASFFKAAGCTDALYLDGFVSKMYCPPAGVEQEDGSFGVIIAETGG